VFSTSSSSSSSSSSSYGGAFFWTAEKQEEKLPVVIPPYECPSLETTTTTTRNISTVAANFNEEYFKAYKEQSTNMTTNMTEFNLTFRESNFDTWGISYEEFKAAMCGWKSKHFPKYLTAGDSIYESAVGIGLNLMMTLEILQEFGIQDIHVHGNEYFSSSTHKANLVLDHTFPAVGGKKGRICTGDSGRLDFVPDDAFDLVYTGCISPIFDPLRYNRHSNDANFYQYKQLCRQRDNTHSKQKDASDKVTTNSK
jgi:hypothetical protein